MTKEEKQLLLTDLCARLPYGVKVQHNIEKEIFGDVEQIEAEGDIDLSYYDEEIEIWKLCCTSIDNIKPYLRPMSSMTEEEKKELGNLVAANMFASQNKDPLIWFTGEALLADFFNKYHIDYRGLITMGLALETKEGMYKIN